MTKLASCLIGVILALGLSGAALAQQQDLEVTMEVVPADAQAGAATREIKLPETAAPRAREAAAFGLETANRARELKGELGREFGQEVRERAQERTPPVVPPKPKP
jgi:uncharacterized protein HemX